MRLVWGVRDSTLLGPERITRAASVRGWLVVVSRSSIPGMTWLFIPVECAALVVVLGVWWMAVGCGLVVG